MHIASPRFGLRGEVVSSRFNRRRERSHPWSVSATSPGYSADAAIFVSEVRDDPDGMKRNGGRMVDARSQVGLRLRQVNLGTGLRTT